ncbi:zinc finger protein PLAGL2-like [Lampris incognitus]|uniref:zinc finger protein PLAGL2-like n=1 Tax=Lampris incognitus TaxID=2546036 RepID=UPI0024B4DD3B|nr:zinc finger protein PLAGL2-like [Lampris incognitus]
MMFQQQGPLKSQVQESHQANRQLFQCQECGKQYNTQLGYRRHLVSAHSSAAVLPSPEGAPSLLEHLGSHNDRPPPPEGNANVSVPVRERKYSCERCDRRFYTRKDVRRHAVVHTGRRDFLCPRCAQRFGRRDHLTRHLKKSHAQEAGLTPNSMTSTAVANLTPATPCPVKEEPSPVSCDTGSTLKEPSETFSMDMYNSYNMANSVPGMGHHHGFMQGSLSSGMAVGRHMPSPSPHPHHLQPPPQQQQHLHGQQQHPYNNMPRYQHGSTSYTRTDVESFLLDLQSGLPPHPSAAPSSSSSAASPQRDALPEVQGVTEMGAGDTNLLSRSPSLSSAELSCATNMDLGPLLGFLPFSLPPYSTHMGMGGLVMGYPSTSTSTVSSPSSSTGLSFQAPGPFTLLQPPQPQVPQGPGAHNHSQLPQGYSSSAMNTSTSLPRYYQTFQQ